MDFGTMFGSFGKIVWGLVSFPVFVALAGGTLAAVLFTLGFIAQAGGIPWKLDAEKLEKLKFSYKWHDLARWLLYDFKRRDDTKDQFREYGLTVYVGRQGSGKTVSMVEYLQRMKKRYPKCLIVTNFGYDGADMRMKDWKDFMTLRNGEEGIIFAIDEIQSEFSSAAWRDFPDSLLLEVCQQRKQRVKIVATAQYFMRVAKPLREQAKSVIVCRTFAGRLTSAKEYDAVEYALYFDASAEARRKLKPYISHSFVQSNALRSSYDTYEKIERMTRTVFSERPLEKE